MKYSFSSLIATFALLCCFFLHRVMTQNTCTITCQNSGFCSQNVCYCPYPYVGDRCQKTLIIEARITVIWIILIIVGVFILGKRKLTQGGLCSILSVLIGNWLFKEEEDVQKKRNEEEVALFNEA